MLKKKDSNLPTVSAVGFLHVILSVKGTSSEFVPVLSKPGVTCVGLWPQAEHVVVKIINLLGFCPENVIY